MDKKYSQKVMEHFLHPRNVGRIKNPSGKGRIGNKICGDVMEMMIKVQEKEGCQIITEAKFLTFGCGAAVATSSIVTELIKGKTIREAKKMTPEKIDKSLGHLPMMKKHCARLAIDALRKAIEDYEKKKIKLASKEKIIRYLKKNRLYSLKKLGQNFLIDQDILMKIVKIADVKKGDKVVEIGPGLGILTSELLSYGAKVTAIEIDQRMIKILSRNFGANKNLNLIHADALDLITKIKLNNYKIIANLPYQITSPFFRKLLSRKTLPNLIVVLVQKEVAERLAALPHHSERGYLSILVQLFGKPKIIKIVKKESFYPQPKVDSAILYLKIRPLEIKTEKRKLLKIIQAGFSQKRKKIKNSISATLRIKPALAERIIRRAEVDPADRAEDLTISQWEGLAQEFTLYL